MSMDAEEKIVFCVLTVQGNIFSFSFIRDRPDRFVGSSITENSGTFLHWTHISAVNDVTLDLFVISGILTMIMVRTLRRDIAQYNKDDDLVNEWFFFHAFSQEITYFVNKGN